MSLTFEEIADAGMPAEDLVSKKPWRAFRKLLLLALLLAVCSGSVYYFNFYKLTPELSESLEHLIVVEGNVPDGVMPHQFDEATEFEEALERHKEHYKEPQFRETPLAAKAVSAPPAIEDVYTAQIAKESEQGEWGVLLKKPIEKIKDTLPQLFVESEEDEAPIQIASATLFPFSETSAVVKAEPVLETEVASANTEEAPVAPVVRVDELDAGTVVQLDLVRDWEGLILVPEGVQLAQAYTSNVRLHRVEAHPIDGGRLRVWSRIQNLTNQNLMVETACEFRFTGHAIAPSRFRPSMIPAGGALDVYFVSSREGVSAYTLMVKQ